MHKQIFAVYDNVAEAILGGLHLFPHKAPAIRMYSDIATMQDSQVARHPNDFDLLLLGVIDEDGTIIATKEIILTGATWAAAQTQSQELKLHAER